MKKLSTIVCATLLSAGMWADTAILSWQLGANGADATPANSITGAAGSEAEGWTISMSDGAEWNRGEKINYNGTDYRTLKNSNGKLITVTLPAGKYASKVEFYAVSNHNDTKGTLKEFDGTSCKDSVNSLKDFANPTYIVKNLEAPKNEFTFLFGGKQVCFLAVVSYTGNTNPNCEEPTISFGAWDEAEDGFPVTLATNEAGVTLSYSVDDAEYVTYSEVFYVGSKAVVAAKASKEGYNDAIVRATAPLHTLVRVLAVDSLMFVKDDTICEGMRFEAPDITLVLNDALWQNDSKANNDPEVPEEFGYTAYIAGQTNPVSKNGAIPTGGCYYTFYPTKDGKLSIAVKLNANKKLCVATTDEQLTVKINGEDLAYYTALSTTTYGIIEFDVTADKTYYIWADGSKIPLFGFYFVPEDEEAAIDNIMQSANSVRKAIRNGQVIIIRDGKEYNMLGSQF